MIKTDCKTEEGITVGLIDSIITISRLLKQRLGRLNLEYEKRSHRDIEDNKLWPEAVYEALKDLHTDRDLLYVLQAGPYNKNILNEDSIKIQGALLSTQEFLVDITRDNKEVTKQLMLYNLDWFKEQIECLKEDMNKATESTEAVKFRTIKMRKKYDLVIEQLSKILE